jgi:hypothetical protein
MGGSTTQQSSTSTSQPWDVQQPYLKQGFDAAQKIYNAPGPAYYPNSTVAPMTASQNTAQTMGSNLAGGSQGYQAAKAANLGLLGGAGGDAVFQNIKSHVLPTVASQFEGSGRYGPNDSFATASTRALTDAYAPFAASQMQSAIGNAQNFNQQDWGNVQNLNQLGQQQQQQGQLETNDAVQRYNYNTQLPQLRLNQFMQNVGGNWGNTTTATQPVYQPGLFSQLLGGGLGIAGLLG